MGACGEAASTHRSAWTRRLCAHEREPAARLHKCTRTALPCAQAALAVVVVADIEHLEPAGRSLPLPRRGAAVVVPGQPLHGRRGPPRQPERVVMPSRHAPQPYTPP